MWKATVGHDVSVKVEAQGDDWDTDPDFVNDITEKEQRWGAKTIEGSGRPEHIDIHQLRSKVSEEHQVLRKKELEMGPKASYGYGGKFGTEKDRMDKTALGHEYVAEVGMHSSQTDAAKGFGGKYGVQKDRADKSAHGFEYKGEVEKHASQTDYAVGFGGKFGVQKDRQDRSALGWAHKEEVVPHQSQTDYAVGFGGKFGVQKDRQDRSALGWAHKEEVVPHQSQTDYAKGFGGRYGVQKDRVDQSAAGFDAMEGPTSAYEKAKPTEAASGGASSLKQRFENMAKSADEENRRRAEEERVRRQARDQRERERQLAQEQQKGAAEEGEEQPPALPPRHSDPEEVARALPPALPVRPPLHPECASGNEDDYEDIVAEPLGHWEEAPGGIVKDEEEEGGGSEGDYEVMPGGPPGYEEPIYEDSGNMDQDYEEIPDRTPGGSGAVPPTGSEGPERSLSALALYDYQGDGDDEISFDPGDTITDIEQVDEGWWRGRCRGAVGLFPANYVELLP